MQGRHERASRHIGGMALACLVGLFAAAGSTAAMEPDAETRCLAYVAYAEAAGEFQPVSQSARLRRALAAPLKNEPAAALRDFGALDRAALEEAMKLARSPALMPDDPTGGALYFVNPRLMEPAKCPWFAALKRTREIGGHVFMTHYGQDEATGEPALDCEQVARDYAAWLKSPRRKRINPAWLVEVEKSPLAGGTPCRVGSYDARTRTYQPARTC
jgi:Cell Wall Hydrolase